MKRKMDDRYPSNNIFSMRESPYVELECRILQIGSRSCFGFQRFRTRFSISHTFIEFPSFDMGKKVGEELAMNVRLWETPEHQPQSLLSSATALVTLILYTCWPQISLTLIALSFVSRVAFTIVVLLFSTLLMPAKPLLWKPFVQSWVFKTWRQYFKFSFLFEEKLDQEKRYVFAGKLS